MINLRNSPFLWFALALLVAFSVAGHVDLSGPGYLEQILFSLWLTGTLLVLLKFKPGQQTWSTVALAIVLFTGGTIRMARFTSEIMPDQPMPGPRQMTGVVEVEEVLKEKENAVSLRCTGPGLSATDAQKDELLSDRFLVVHIREPELKKIRPGDRLLVKGWVSAIRGPANPHAFDIRTYYRSIGIRHQMNCKGTDVSWHPGVQHSLLRLTAGWQSYLCAIVRANTSPPVAQLTNALVWGDRTYMDDDIREAFANSGAMHVLSVSGMHMAIVYSMLYLVLGAPGSGSHIRRLVRLGFYMLAIGLYMGLTGACPAVVRSGLMIILYLLGKAMGWNTQIWNLLGFAAFIMLWINPFVMYNIGFQLSFLAMAGILLYAKPIIRYFTFQNILIHRTWEVTAVSIAAQVFIFPLLLFHFYQFPLTFVASSLVAMPASYLVIFGTLLNISISGLDWQWLWKFYDVACHWFILTMKWMAGLNPEMNYSLPVISNILLSAMAILFSIALVYRWPYGKKIAYLLGIAAFLNLAWHRMVQWNTNELTIYHQYQGLLIDVMVDGRCISIRDSLLTHRSIDFAARGNRCYKDVISVQDIFKTAGIATTTWQYIPPLLKIPDHNLLIWNSREPGHLRHESLSYIIIDQCPSMPDLKNFLCAHPGPLVILPAHLDRYIKNGLVRFLTENDIRFYDISEQGYFNIPL